MTVTKKVIQVSLEYFMKSYITIDFIRYVDIISWTFKQYIKSDAAIIY